MASARDFAGGTLFWSALAVSVLMFLGVFTPHTNRTQKNDFPEGFVAVSGTSRDKPAKQSYPEKRTTRPIQAFPTPQYPVQDIRTGVASIRASYGHFIREASAAQGISPRIIEAIIIVESRGNPYAVSKRSCKGLMQICDGTARQYGVGNVFNPRENILGGTRIFADYLEKKGGDFDKALVAYNAGPASGVFENPSVDLAQHEYVRAVKLVMRKLES